jgi:ketosteroid isomerase-like protein
MLGTSFAVATLLASGVAAAPARPEVMAPIRQFIDGFNKGDAKTALAACASPASVIDEIPPYAWQGPTACQDWANEFEAWAKKNGISAPFVVLGKARHVDASGDRAYVVLPATFKYKHDGKAASQTGATLTVALQKIPDGWRITGWTWSHGSGK